MPGICLLTAERLLPRLLAVPAIARAGNGCKIVYTLDDVPATVGGAHGVSVLLVFGSGVIVPQHMLEGFGGHCYNVHCASPEYPGRDPHHFAAYDGSTSYGATAHVMEVSVDAGPIVDVERIDVAKDAGPKDFLDAGEEAGFLVLDRLASRLLAGEAVVPIAVRWGSPKTTRRDFVRLCRISPVEHRDEFERRRKAAAMGDFRNLHIDVHGWRFRIEAPAGPKESGPWSDFTEAAYARLLDAATSKYRFATFREPGKGRHVLWRHDVEFSVHRARRIAAIEQERGVTATYFFNLSRPYYNLLEPEVTRLARDILALGHRAGLRVDLAEGTERIEREKRILEELLDAEVDALSAQAPAGSGAALGGEREFAGLVNADSEALRERYACYSDGCGYSRSAPIADVIRDSVHERLLVLTRPVLWAAEPCAPRSRIEQAVLGRARRALEDYDERVPDEPRRNLI